MRVKALVIHLGEHQAGLLFQYGDPDGTQPPVIRFVADDDFARLPDAPMLSASMLAANPDAQRALWADITAPLFNGRFSVRDGWLLPAFFQGLLPEGVFRDHVAQARGCDPKDHFEMLAACGLDLPGNVRALPVNLEREALTRLVTQQADALEMSVVADPLDEGVSLSGVQPKLGVLREGGRYVGRTKLRDTHVIAKLPAVGYPRLPELEALSLRLAETAGVEICEARLEPLSRLAAPHRYDLGTAGARTRFLAVERFDRTPAGRVHVEDFGQVLGVAPEDKYTRSYLEIAAVMRAMPSLGERAVHELLRRLVVNEMLGNPDMHLKNIGLVYRDGRTPRLSPAYDIVGYSAYAPRTGHALHILPPDPEAKPRARITDPAAARAARPRLTPVVLRRFCNALDLPEKPAAAAVAGAIRAAAGAWPGLIETAGITAMQKTRLLAHFDAHPLVQSLRRRQARA